MVPRVRARILQHQRLSINAHYSILRRVRSIVTIILNTIIFFNQQTYNAYCLAEVRTSLKIKLLVYETREKVELI